MARFRQIHKAQCSECGYVERERESGSFIDSSFLPSFCSGCGENMTPKRLVGDGDPHWRHVVTKQEYMAPVRTMNPLSWIIPGYWEKREETSWKA